jgi:hypothetical protein
VSRAAFGRVDDSIVTSNRRGKMHTVPGQDWGGCRRTLARCWPGQRSVQRRCNQDGQFLVPNAFLIGLSEANVSFTLF